MIGVETVDLARRGVALPTDQVGMVLAQPHAILTPIEPFCWEEGYQSKQLELLSKTLSIARRAEHGAEKTHFTVFPEYSIPGPAGIELIDKAVSAGDWADGTFVIGGTDALSKDEFTCLVGAEGSYIDETRNSLDRLSSKQWVNCCITWIKSNDGTVERWFQPKLWPNWTEQNITSHQMFRGESLFIFKGPLGDGSLDYRLSTLVCFDWIATVHNQKSWRWLLQQLQGQAEQIRAELRLSWLFVIQCNPKPSHTTFLSEVSSFFDHTICPSVLRDRTCLVFANTAGRNGPGKASEYGCSGLIFAPQTNFERPSCHPTFSNGGAQFRANELLSGYHDLLFRERGACIHSFAQVDPSSVQPGPSGRKIALESASVFPAEQLVDPRVPAAPVPACTKWLNDLLDVLPGLGKRYSHQALSPEAKASHEDTTAKLRTLDDKVAMQAVTLGASESTAKHPDEWQTVEADAVGHMVDTLVILGVGFSACTVGAIAAHATVVIGGKAIDIVAVRGATHSACIEHARKFPKFPRRDILLVSRDHDNTPWKSRFGSYLSPEPTRLGEERKITDPESGNLHLGYEMLLSAFINSKSASELEKTVHAKLDA